jgi:hypothetical protein
MARLLCPWSLMPIALNVGTQLFKESVFTKLSTIQDRLQIKASTIQTIQVPFKVLIL